MLDAGIIESRETEGHPRNPRLFQALTFGHWASGIDWIWIRALQDQATAQVQPGRHVSNFYQLKLVTDLDPAYWEIYAFGAIFLAVVRNDVEGARELLEKGEAFRTGELSSYSARFQSDFWSQSWAVPFNLAYVHLFELENLPEASEYYRRAAAISGAPDYLGSLAARLSTTAGQYEVGLRLLDFLMGGASNSRLRTTLERKRDALLKGSYLYELNRSFREQARSVTDARALDRLWREFREKRSLGTRDPWGGGLSLDSGGRIVSSSHRTGSFGMEF